MTTLTQINRFTPSAPPPSYQEAMGIKIQPTAPAQSLEDALIELGQRSNNEHIRNIAKNHITSRQPNLATKIKTFFTEKWTVAKAYPQASVNNVKNIFNSIYYHPAVPYIGAGLLGTATGLLMGLSIPAGFMLGVAVKLGSTGLDAINSAANRVFNWIKGSKSQIESTSQSSFNQTVRMIPIAVLSFSLGLNSYNLALAAKIAAAAVVIGAGAFTLGTTLQVQ
ncbi:hypothetical protein [Candidatus Rhabdochlamydia porcellionis]|jgi:hypothetical protein|uniref:Uncharacterized protein n=1 Tax=Candidatus Rhabdochlamydia porcellionis TaxID=225148 RepID=A0ABX8YZM7_9BACT|nr:hypothetical protein [Candidatus Rhabdochlamydia porcellionis]QZA58846.1 hypothetical protein RHAB15C_0000725 [Candidatus Rhabdochlamydia porcellionis]